MGTTQGYRPVSRDDIVRQALAGNIPPEALPQALSELAGRLTAVEGELNLASHQLALTEHERLAIRDECAAMRRALLDAKDQTARVTAALALTQAREKERARPRQALRDAGDEYGNLCPDPRGARTAAELIGVLRRFRIWAGNPSYRDMSQRCTRRAGASTMCTVLNGAGLPERLEVIDAIVEGCGGSEEDRRRFATAWRLLAGVRNEASPPSFPPLLRAVQTAGINGEDDTDAYAEPIASNS